MPSSPRSLTAFAVALVGAALPLVLASPAHADEVLPKCVEVHVLPDEPNVPWVKVCRP